MKASPLWGLQVPPRSDTGSVTLLLLTLNSFLSSKFPSLLICELWVSHICLWGDGHGPGCPCWSCTSKLCPLADCILRGRQAGANRQRHTLGWWDGAKGCGEKLHQDKGLASDGSRRQDQPLCRSALGEETEIPLRSRRTWSLSHLGRGKSRAKLGVRGEFCWMEQGGQSYRILKAVEMCLEPAS